MLDSQPKDQAYWAKRYLYLVARAADLEAQKVEVNKEKAAVAKKLGTYLDDTDSDQIRLKNGASVFLKKKFRARVNKEDQPALKEWLTARGDDWLFEDYVHHSRLSTYIEELVINGEEVPDYVKRHTDIGLTHRMNGYDPLSGETE